MLVPLNKTSFYPIARDTMDTVDAIIASRPEIPELKIYEDGSGFGHNDHNNNYTDVAVESMGGLFSRYRLKFNPNDSSESPSSLIITREDQKIMLEKQDEPVDRVDSRIISSILRIGESAISQLE